MKERSKIEEARHFLQGMQTNLDNTAAVTCELSAFLATARSVLQYAFEEAKLKPGGQNWYDQAMADPLFRYFKDKRDTNIHRSPVIPARTFRTESAGLLSIGDDGDEILIPKIHNRIVANYEFQDRPGEDLLGLAAQYLEGLDAFVEDGVAKGWITG